MKPAAVLRIVIVLLLGLFAWWFVVATEWVEEEVSGPKKGEALRNPLFAMELLARQLGVRLEKRENLEQMPPRDAVLLLDSSDWDLFPERVERLRQWVQDGGHLVVSAYLAREGLQVKWMPVRTASRPRKDPDDEKPARKQSECRVLVESGTAGAAPYRVCGHPFWQELKLREGVRPLWTLEGAEGIELVRAPAGRGTVTVYSTWNMLHNDEVLRSKTDHAAAAAAALQLQPGKLLWVVAEEKRTPLIPWVWQKAWVAVLLVLLVAAAWLWRGVVRFGPVGVVPPPQRRSMREQVSGTGAFLRHHGPVALHTAQVRALHEAARMRLPGYAQARGSTAVERIARATGLGARALEAALAPAPIDRPGLAADLELLELARRRLADSTSHFSSSP